MKKIMLIVFAFVFLAALSFISSDAGACECYPSYLGSGTVECVASVTTYNLSEGACPSAYQGYDACSPGYRPQCGNADSYLTCDTLDPASARDHCSGPGTGGSCNCVPGDDFPFGTTCYDLLGILDREGGCSNDSTPPAPAQFIDDADTEGILYDYVFNGGEMGHYYCEWEGDDGSGNYLPSHCVACPEGFRWEDNTQSCVCTNNCASPGTGSCLNDGTEQICVSVGSGCNAYQEVNCADGQYCSQSGSSVSCASCPTSSNGACINSECTDYDPDCNCNDQSPPGYGGICGIGCNYITDPDCNVPLNVTCSPLVCDGTISSASGSCSTVDPDGARDPSDGICCPHDGWTEAQDSDCAFSSVYSYSPAGVLETQGGNNQKNFVYDLLKRLVSFEPSEGFIEEYFYDASGKRVKKVTPKETIYYTYQGNDVLYTDEQIFCACPKWGDPNGDGTIVDVLDVVQTVNVAFRGFSSSKDPACPSAQTDVDSSGATDVLDVVKVVGVAFRGFNRAAIFSGNPCDSGAESPFEPIGISISQPLNGATITQDTLVVANLDRSEPDVSVKFYVNNNFVYVDSTSPYEYTLKITDVISTPGSHTIKAEAVRNSNGEVVGISSIINLNVPTLGANVVLNPGYESVSGSNILNWLTDWGSVDTLNDAQFIVSGAANCASGSICSKSINNKCYLGLPSGEAWFPLQRGIRLKPDTKYLLSYWTKQGTGATQMVELETRDTSNNALILTYGVGSPNASWQKISEIVTSHKTSQVHSSVIVSGLIDYSLHTLAKNDAIGSCTIFNYIDDIEVREIGPATGTSSAPKVGTTPTKVVQEETQPAVSTQTKPVAPSQANATNSTTSTCINECSSGQLKCSGSYSQTCGNYDTDSCLEWSTGTFCQYGCTNGLCNSTPGNVTASCFENDRGNQLYTKGNNLGRYDNGTSFNVSDYCADSYNIREYWCNPNLQLNTYDCRNYGNKICVKGVCVVGNQTNSSLIQPLVSTDFVINKKTPIKGATLTANAVSEDKSVFGGILNFFKKVFGSSVTGEVVITTKEPSVLILKEGAKNFDGTRNIDIYLMAQRPTNGIQFNVIYDPTKVTLDKISSPTNFQVYTYNAGVGNLLIGMYDGGNGDKIEIGTSKILTMKTKSVRVASNMIKNLKDPILSDAEILESYGPINVKNSIVSTPVTKPSPKKPFSPAKPVVRKVLR
ncbi:MAG TPA: Ig-like domain-containing protein [Candidatus Nanoarchaeia archaeon]|nr:Ig-like domain-containing protein [Candidatus Nanoarchaeia archaeon]